MHRLIWKFMLICFTISISEAQDSCAKQQCAAIADRLKIQEERSRVMEEAFRRTLNAFTVILTGASNLVPSDHYVNLTRTLQSDPAILSFLEMTGQANTGRNTSQKGSKTETGTSKPESSKTAGIPSTVRTLGNGRVTSIKLSRSFKVVVNGISPQSEETVNDIKEALKCSNPSLFSFQTLYARHEDRKLSVSLENDSLSISLKGDFEGCNKHLTGFWVHVSEERQGYIGIDQQAGQKHTFDMYVPRKCFVEDVQSNLTHMTLLLPSPLCNLTLGELVVCRTYKVQVAVDFRSLASMKLDQVVFVPPKVVSETIALQNYSSSSSDSVLNVTWSMPSNVCRSQLSSLSMNITKIDNTSAVVSSLNIPKHCLGLSNDKQVTAILPSERSISCPKWKPLDKCRKYRMNVKTNFFDDKWEGKTSSWEIFTAQDPDVLLQRLKSPKKFIVCPSDFFSCRTEDNKCISLNWLCDGQPDCSNHLDEMHCTTTSQDCTNKFTCGRQCLPQHRICDGYVDCEQGEDEQNCGVESCCHWLTSPTGHIDVDSSPTTTSGNCSYLIETKPDGYLLLSFVEFHSTQVSITVHDGPYPDSPVLLSHNDRSLPHSIRSSSNTLYLNVPQGILLKIVYTTVEDSSISISNGCGGYVLDEGQIKSPPIGYGLKCWWYIESRNQLSALLLYNNNLNITNYSMKIYDGWTSLDNVVIHESLALHSKPNVYPVSNKFRVLFEVYSAEVYEWGVKSIYSPQCRAILTEPNGTIQSPNYPSPYSNSTDCRWTIQLNAGSKIRLTFAYLDLDPYRDLLHVYDGPSIRSPVLLSTIDKIPSLHTVTSSSNEILVRLTTDDSVQRTGFLIIYSSVSSGH